MRYLIRDIVGAVSGRPHDPVWKYLDSILQKPSDEQRRRDVFVTATEIYACLTEVERWARIPMIGNWRYIEAPLSMTISVLKEYTDLDELVTKEVFQILWKHEPRMMRRVQKHLVKAGIKCDKPLSET